MNADGYSGGTERTMTEAGYYYAPLPVDTDWDRYSEEYEQWIRDNYNDETGLVFNRPFEDVMEDDNLFYEYCEERRWASE
jgi:hypothetical protein